MQTAMAPVPMVSEGLGEGNVFSIQASPKAFEILSTNLYQNKILAVIREISCNAADAMTMVGKDPADIEVTLPTWSDPHFSVRDYGPGLSHANMLRLYTTFFLSDKDKTNSLIGGLGLGSKAPFAVADQFTVVSRFDGEKRTYAIFKDNGIPTIRLVSAEPSDEPTGLTVQVPVANLRTEEWRHEANNYFSWWATAPKVWYGKDRVSIVSRWGNLPIKSSTTTQAGYPHWCKLPDIRPQFVATNWAFMGLVPYKLDFSAIPALAQAKTITLAKLNNLVLAFDIGELEISPSREALSYSPATCARIVQRLTEIKQQWLATLQADLNALPTLYAARVALATKDSDTFLSAFRVPGSSQATWKGKPIPQEVIWPGLSDPVHISGRTKVRHRKNPTSVPAFTVTKDYPLAHSISAMHSNTFFWIPTGIKITAAHYRTLVHNIPTTAVGYGVYLTDTGYLVQSPDYDVLAREWETVGLPPIKRLSDMPAAPPDPKNPTGNSSNAPKTVGYTINNSFSYSRLETAVDLQGGGHYFSFFDGKPVSPMTYLWYISEAIQPAQRKVGFSETRLKSARFRAHLAKAGWKHITPDTAAEINPAILANYTKLSKWYNTSQSMNHPKLTAFLRLIVSLPPATFPTDWQDLCQFLYKVRSPASAGAFSTNWWTNWPTLTQTQKDAIDQAELDFETELATLNTWLDTHPLLGYISGTPAPADIHAYLTR